MYHSQSMPSPHSICPWVTWLLICRIDLISKVLFKCSITPLQPWSVSRFCLESGWIANAASVAVAKHLATEAGPCRAVIRALEPGKITFFKLTERNLNTCVMNIAGKRHISASRLQAAGDQQEIQIDYWIMSEVLMNDVRSQLLQGQHWGERKRSGLSQCHHCYLCIQALLLWRFGFKS